MLRPVDNDIREIKILDGLWRFWVQTNDQLPAPYKSRLPGNLECPVPSSYNDLFVLNPIKHHVGTVWYQRQVHIPRRWREERVFLRFDSATHEAHVYANDTLVAHHIGGYTPFEANLSKEVTAETTVLITVAVSNVLTNETIPPGKVEVDELGAKKQIVWHDFFNYAGLHRSVRLCCVPATHIEDIVINTDVKSTTGVVRYNLDILGKRSDAKVTLYDEDNQLVASAEGVEGELLVHNAKLWQPGAAYLYTLQARLYDGNTVIDEYSLNSVGIRTVKVSSRQFLINDRPFYFKGFGWHEDRPIKGKGHDNSWMVHDLELMKWCGANSFRTSHYPYAEEVYEYCDRQGWVVIDETPGVGLNLNIKNGIFGKATHDTWSDTWANDRTRDAHADSIRQLIRRDKNHPCVVMWCITNEPDASLKGAFEYFQPLTTLARLLDPSRPLCYTNMVRSQPETDLMHELFDVIGLNRYYGWYSESGNLPLAACKLEKELRNWARVTEKPLVMMEYGADTQSGLHSTQAIPWSEEYQARYYETYNTVFDKVDAVQGEQVWAFADFATDAAPFRVDGNKKGIFDRNRQPKAAAEVLRKRWTAQ